MHRNFTRENRETLWLPEPQTTEGRWEKVINDKVHMNGHRESHNVIVPTKQPNESQGGPKEVVEGRALTKENVEQPNPFLDTEPQEWVKQAEPRTRSGCMLRVTLLL